MQELTIKTSKYADILEENKQDLTSLNSEFKSTIAQQGDAQKEETVLRRKIYELSAQNKVLYDTLERIREEKHELEEKNSKLHEINSIAQADCKCVQ